MILVSKLYSCNRFKGQLINMWGRFEDTVHKKCFLSSVIWDCSSSSKEREGMHSFRDARISANGVSNAGTGTLGDKSAIKL